MGRKQKSNDEFIKESITIHGLKYDYGETKYTTIKEKVKLSCLEHSVTFECWPQSHLKGYESCPLCKKLNRKKSYYEFGLGTVAAQEKSKTTKFEKYGNESYTNREAAEETCYLRYGDRNYNNQEKYKQTCELKYGKDFNWRDNTKTLYVKYGVTNPIRVPGALEKRESTFKERYGGRSSFHLREFQIEMARRAHSPSARRKRESTTLIRYGVSHYSHTPQFVDNNHYKSKQYTLPSGDFVNLMGYEHHAVDFLLKSGYTEEELTLENRPTITYVWEVALGGDDSVRVYHPDIIINKEHKIIEVKSEYTITTDNRLAAKKKACIEQGWKFELWLIQKNGNIEIQN